MRISIQNFQHLLRIGIRNEYFRIRNTAYYLLSLKHFQTVYVSLTEFQVTFSWVFRQFLNQHIQPVYDKVGVPLPAKMEFAQARNLPWNYPDLYLLKFFVFFLQYWLGIYWILYRYIAAARCQYRPLRESLLSSACLLFYLFVYNFTFACHS